MNLPEATASQPVADPGADLPQVMRESDLLRLLGQIKALRESTEENVPQSVRESIGDLLAMEGTKLALQRLECLHEITQYGYQIGNIDITLDVASAAVRLARKAGDRAWLRKSLNAYAVVVSRGGGLTEGLDALCEALDICDELNDPVQTASVYNNIGVHLILAELAHSAMAALRISLKHSTQVGDRRDRLSLLASAQGNLAETAFLTGQYGQGMTAVMHALQTLEAIEPKTPWHILHESIALRDWARLALKVNDIATATACTSRAIGWAQTHRLGLQGRLAVEVTVGLYEAYTGKALAGVARLERCLADARPTEQGTEAYYVRALIEAAEFNGMTSVATHYRRELAAVLRRVHLDAAHIHHRSRLYALGLNDAAISRDNQSAPTESSTTSINRRAAATHPEQRLQALESLSAAAELQDDPSGEHPWRVGVLAFMLARRTGCDPATCDEIAVAARLHDIGKIGVPSEILRKSEPLTSVELETVRQHAANGAEFLASAEIEGIGMAIDIARHHHEWWNGGGYPDGLAAAAIPLPARITAIAEAFDAMTHDRPHRPAFSVSRALEMISERAGRQFDPQLVPEFRAMVIELQRNHDDLDKYLGRDAGKASQFVRVQRRLAQRLGSATVS
ncbi:MAG: HD-GYP domain-containing protein [Candidatus Binataceae bacterium]